MLPLGLCWCINQSRLVCVLLRRGCGCSDSLRRGIPCGSKLFLFVTNLPREFGCRQKGGDYRKFDSARVAILWVAELHIRSIGRQVWDLA